MKPFLFLTFSCFLSLSGFSQNRVIDVDKGGVDVRGVFYTIGGEPFVNVKFVRLVEGTPYFREEWLKGSVILSGGRVYNNLSLKLDLYDNEVHYLDDKGVEYVASTPIKQVAITDRNIEHVFLHSSVLPANNFYSKPTWYLRLSQDTVSLYKYFNKQVSESKPYGQATAEQQIRTQDKYWVLYNNSWIEIKKLKEAPALFGDKKQALENFLKNKDDKTAPMDQRLVAFINHLNTLVQTAK